MSEDSHDYHKPKRTKFNIDTSGLGDFGSQVELERFQMLQQLERSGKISGLEAHPKFVVSPDGCAKLKFTGDSKYVDVAGIFTKPGTIVVEDVKGMGISEAATIRMKLFRWKYPDHTLLICRGKYVGKRIVGFKTDEFPVRKKRVVRNPRKKKNETGKD